MIAIKDIKMPVNCEECFARLLSWCRLDEEERMVIPALPDESFEGRPEWCPLVDVPDIVGKCSEIPNSSDRISRQEAFDAFIEILDKPNHAEFLYTDEICRVLESLPSVKLKRKKGRGSQLSKQTNSVNLIKLVSIVADVDMQLSTKRISAWIVA